MNTPQLYPLSIGEILDRAFSLYRRKFGLLIGIGLVTYVPLTTLQILSFFILENITFLNWLQNVFIDLLVSGALVIAISRIYLGRQITIREAYGMMSRRYGSVWGGNFLMGLLIVLPILVFICPLVFFLIAFDLTPETTGFNLIIILVLIPVAAFFFTRWLLTIPCILLEKLKASDGLRRSWGLTQGYFWRVFSTTFLVSLLVITLGTIPQYAVTFGLEYLLPGSEWGPLAQRTVSQMVLVFMSPISQGVSVVLFYDLLVRKEGFDLTFQLDQESAIKEESDGTTEIYRHFSP